MAQYEYKVIPAPNRGRKAPGIRKPEARFAYGLQEVMNEAAAEGWEYQRADILPSEERQGLTSSQTVYRSVLVFRRLLAGAATAAEDGTDAAAGADAAVLAVAAAEAAGDDLRAVYQAEAPRQAPEPNPQDAPAADTHDEAPVTFADHAEPEPDHADLAPAAYAAEDDDTAPQHDFETYEDATAGAAPDDTETPGETEDHTVNRG